MSDEVSRTSTDENASIVDTSVDGDEGETEGLPTVESVSDPAELIDGEDVEHFERTYPHEDPDHCETNAVGRSVVGVTNDAGEVLLLVSEDGSHAVLPNCTVDPDEDWAAVGWRTVEEATGVAVDIETVERVRTVHHVVEGDQETQARSHHVVFGASPVAGRDEGDEPSVSDDGWTGGWYGEMPVPVDSDLPAGIADGIDDVRLFLD